MNTFFERHPKATLLVVWGVCLLLLVIALEYVGRTAFGLGNPVVYQTNPVYGYRPLPNQDLTRHHGKRVALNNLALRAETDWDEADNHHILFIGDSVTYGGSYVANEELFSHLVGQALAIPAGNAAVNAWGVDNAVAFLDHHPMPAKIVVSVFPEMDFYRGLNRFGGQPFWPRKPGSALEELYYYYLYKLNNRKYYYPAAQISDADNQQALEIATAHLKALDTRLKAQGITHYIFITPDKAQALGQAPRNANLSKAFKDHNLSVHYLDTDITPEAADTNIAAYYYDGVHLTPEGHAQWARYITQVIQKEAAHDDVSTE